MADITQMGLSAPPMAVPPGTELGMGVPGMPPPQLHHEHNGPQEQPHDDQPHEGLGQEQPQPVVGAEDVVKLFGFITSEFRGFLAHVEHAVQTFQTTGSVPSQPLYRVKAELLPAAKGSIGGHAGGPGPGRPRKIKRDKIVRKPTAFNHFVREKMADLKAQGMTIEEDKNNNELFKLAVAEWSKLSPEQKKAWKEAYFAAHPELLATSNQDDEAHEGEGEDVSEEHAQMLLDAGAGAQAAAGAKRKVGTAQLAHLPPPGAHQPDGMDEHISLTELVTGGEDPVAPASAAVAAPTSVAAPAAAAAAATAAAAAAEQEEHGRKKRKGTSVKSKP